MTRAKGSKTSSEPCDLVVDMLGEGALKRSFDYVKPGGTIVSIRGGAPEGLAAEPNMEFHSFFMQPGGELLAEIATHISNGTVRPILDSTSPSKTSLPPTPTPAPAAPLATSLSRTYRQ